jgi:hypothetical protein
MTTIQSTSFCNIELPPSCVEVSPCHPDYFLIGTYHLIKIPPTESKSEDQREKSSKASEIQNAEDQDASKQERRGSIILCGTEGTEM